VGRSEECQQAVSAVAVRRYEDRRDW
jgi:hypothetical protein